MNGEPKSYGQPYDSCDKILTESDFLYVDNY